MSAWPITLDDVHAARERLRPHLLPTPLRRYAALDAAVGQGIRVLVKHENHLPTNAFKARNALAVLTTLSAEDRRRGVIAASRGNHGLGLAWAGQLLGVPVVICVPQGNNPEKNAAICGLGAELVEHGRDYDEALARAHELKAARGLCMVHSTNHPGVLAGAGTIALELLEQAEGQGERLDALVVAVGGGSQAVGALTVMRALRPALPVYGVQAAGASAIHDGWHAGTPVSKASADTFADGLATRTCYELTFPALCEGLRGFVTVTEAEIADALRLVLGTTHNLAEGAGATGLAGLRVLARTLADSPADSLAGKTVAVVLSGSNIDQATLRAVLTRTL